MRVKKLLGTPPPQQEARQKRDADNAHDDRKGVGPHRATRSRRLMGGHLCDGLALLAQLFGGLVQPGLCDGSRLLGELRQVILRELARFERASGHRLGHAAGITFIDTFEPGHGFNLRLSR